MVHRLLPFSTFFPPYIPVLMGHFGIDVAAFKNNYMTCICLEKGMVTTKLMASVATKDEKINRAELKENRG